MPSPLCPHVIPAHWGNIGGKSDKQWLAELDPAFVKVVTDDETVPYIDQYQPAAKIIVRNYPMSELGHDRGFATANGARLASALAAARTDPATESAGRWEGSGRDLLVSGSGAFASPYRGWTGPGAPMASGISSHPETVGHEHAATCDRIARWCEAHGVPRTRLLFEGLNEPMLWSVEPPAQVARYYRQFLISLHEFNLRGVAGNFGVGWPGNGGVQDAPVEWDFFKPVIDVMNLSTDRPDYLGLHEYWALNGPGENWRWWGGRYEQCPFNVPILITETGIDTGVTGRFYGGWGDLPGQMTERAERYLNELFWYWEKCRADGRVQGIFPFTYDRGSDTWVQFDCRNEDWLRKATSMTFAPPAPFVWGKPEPKPEPVTDPLLQTLQRELKYKDWRKVLPRESAAPYPFQHRLSQHVTDMVVHHDAVLLARIPDLLERAKVIAKAHINRGYTGAAYHFLIGPDGTVAQLNGLDVVSWHCGDRAMNNQAVGVCFAGDYRTDEPTAAALDAFDKLYAVLDEYLVADLAVCGHRDVTTTICPGDKLYDVLFITEPMPEDEPEFTKAKAIYWTEEATRKLEPEQYDSYRAHDILVSLKLYLDRMPQLPQEGGVTA